MSKSLFPFRFLLPVPVDHYENFPVASWLLPGRLREPVSAIYRFARSADDLADEGDAPPRARLQELARYHSELDRIERGEIPDDPIFGRLAAAIRAHALPLTPFRDLLSAFAQDIEKTRYASFGEVMDYCRRSANPVGRLMLHLYGDHDPRHQAYSDAICSSLQLINFLQDVAIDYAKGRIYLPQDELAAHHVSEAQIAAGDAGGLWRMMMHKQIERARKLLQAGAPLGRALDGRIGLELRVTIRGGETILRKLHADPGCVFGARPVLGKRDWIVMLARSVL
ncbi:putative phytoene synthase-like protein [Thiobacillus denitrificans ATCC 25259]|uniref:Putative phytoene synthase-like protein n=1 Tax=Thiobacillus denitrificans (strain ATCC 25259 / T1) TaxID=292415 RepID=Q3SI79_THIDA|nr:squalene synthase HpnC [Thiobacillus denitrificans]AAZ97649.1 putative phytoene synthase-like protein [Thiobacillus denitrificans ATCC 25259]